MRKIRDKTIAKLAAQARASKPSKVGDWEVGLIDSEGIERIHLSITGVTRAEAVAAFAQDVGSPYRTEKELKRAYPATKFIVRRFGRASAKSLASMGFSEGFIQDHRKHYGTK